MGYNTDFSGEIRFSRELTKAEQFLIKGMLDKLSDAQELAEEFRYTAQEHDYYSYHNLRLNEEGNAIEWNGGEKTYEMPTSMRVVIHAITCNIPDIIMNGVFLAQGGEIGDVWKLMVIDNVVIEEKVSLESMGKREVNCPHCGGRFTIEA